MKNGYETTQKITIGCRMFHDCNVLSYDALHRQLMVIATANHGNNKKRYIKKKTNKRKILEKTKMKQKKNQKRREIDAQVGQHNACSISWIQCSLQTAHKHIKHFPIRYSLLLIICFYRYIFLPPVAVTVTVALTPHFCSILPNLCCFFSNPLCDGLCRICCRVLFFFYIDVYVANTRYFSYPCNVVLFGTHLVQWYIRTRESHSQQKRKKKIIAQCSQLHFVFVDSNNFNVQFMDCIYSIIYMNARSLSLRAYFVFRFLFVLLAFSSECLDVFECAMCSVHAF